MAFDDLRTSLETRLDEAVDGARAWWLLTRVHVNAARLQAAARYIGDAADAAGVLALAPGHYGQLAAIFDVKNETDPRQTINRHYLLSMESPLLLIEKLDGRFWTRIRLTDSGTRLATEPDASGVLEGVLRQIRFCRAPWYSADRTAAFSEFDVQPYAATIKTLSLTGGFVTTDEFDLFVSRIRTPGEVAGAAAGINEYRTLSAEQQKALLKLVADRIPGTVDNPRKRYQNWRDMGRHTFGLLSLGEALTQVGNVLRLTESFVGEAIATTDSALAPAATGPAQKKEFELKLPNSSPSPELETPPTVPPTNSGADAELLIGKMLSAAGWQVVYYTNRRGYGFDLWAKKGNQTFVIEVKSSLGILSTVTLTKSEHEAAKHHAKNYLLVLVENISAAVPEIFVVQDPANTVPFGMVEQTQYLVSAADCKSAAAEGVYPFSPAEDEILV